jgi:UDP:flavonoid glycosyltransferase YjiC (YdhE family)
VVAALKDQPVRVALAVGSADRDLLGGLPENWLVREFLPQVALLERAALAVTHGGNNSVTESLLFGVPMLVLPFSTDQFTGAAAIESGNLGLVLDPNAATADQLRLAAQALLRGETARWAADLGATLRDKPGRQIAFEALTAHA